MNAHSSSPIDARSSVTDAVCDSHVHVFDPARFPYSHGRSYSPATATRETLAAFLADMGSQRVVLVQPSVYGSDNACLLDGLNYFGGRARGVAVIDPATVSDADISSLKLAGVRALRVNFEACPSSAPEDRTKAIKETAEHARRHGLKVQIFSNLAAVVTCRAAIESLGVEVILDHFAGLSPQGSDHRDFSSLLEMVKSGSVWIKLSAPSRISKHETNQDLAPFVAKLAEAAPDRLVWASDWPHTGGGKERASRPITEVEPFRQVDDRKLLDQLVGWIGDCEIARKVLVENPAKLFDF